MSGDMRRPPQVWEQRLAGKVNAVSVGIDSVAPGASSPVVDSPEVPVGYEEPDDTTLVIGAPSAPFVTGGVGDLTWFWDGLDDDGDPYSWPSQYAELYVGAGGTFTPGTATYVGDLRSPSSLITPGLLAGTVYYGALVGKDLQGNTLGTSTWSTATPGIIDSSTFGTAWITTDMVGFDARGIGGVTNTVGTAPFTPALAGDVWLDTTPGTAVIHKVYNGSTWVINAWGSASIAAGQITALQMAAGAITAGAIAAGAVTTDKLTAGTITGFVVNASTVRTSGTVGAGVGGGVLLNTSGLYGYNAAGAQTFGINATTGAVTIGTADASNFITAGQVNGNVTSISAGAVTSGTFTGLQFRTASSGARIKMADASAEYGLHSLEFYDSSARRMAMFTSAGAFWMAGNTVISGDTNITGTFTVGSSGGTITSAGAISGSTLNISGANVDMAGVYSNNTTGIDTVGITTGYRLRRISSTQAIKYDMAPLAGTLSASVDAGRILGPATVDPFDVLTISPTEFSVIDDGEPTDRRVVGFIADDVADKFPLAATHDEDGTPAGVLDTAILAALLAVVREQQTTIADLTARIEALEA